jgi:hypothetical protein
MNAVSHALGIRDVGVLHLTTFFRLNVFVFWPRNFVFDFIVFVLLFDFMCAVFMPCVSLTFFFTRLAARDSFGNSRDKLANVVATCKRFCCIHTCVWHCVTPCASRWTGTVVASLFGPYPERSDQGAMLAGAMGASVAVYSQEVYSGTYTVSSAPAQQSRLCVVDANAPSDCQTNCFETRSFFRGVLALLGGLSVTYYHNLASLHSAGRGPLETFETVFDAHACYPWRVTVCSGQLSAPPATVMKTAVDRFSATNTIGISSCCNLQCAFVIRTPCSCLGP